MGMAPKLISSSNVSWPFVIMHLSCERVMPTAHRIFKAHIYTDTHTHTHFLTSPPMYQKNYSKSHILGPDIPGSFQAFNLFGPS